MSQILIDGRWFVDEHRRKLMLRGVNLGGSSKVPTQPNGATWNKEGFYDHRSVSFVGRPFPLEEADEHFARLRHWGFTFLRFLVTWEAIEHAGPGIYDQDYLEYLQATIEKAAQHGIWMFIDPHQDVWSRFSGGDGAPGWTFEIAGMDITKLHDAGAAILHQESGNQYPRMVWSSNYYRYAAATMFTLFFGGNRFAPQLTVDGTPIQEYLQVHYFNAVKQVAHALKGFPNVIGYGPMNEPSQGFIGYRDVNQIPAYLVAQQESPTIYEGMLMASGYPQKVLFKSQLPINLRRRYANTRGISIWLPGHEPIWQMHGVWEVDRGGQPHLNKPDYFVSPGGQTVNFYQDHFIPFLERYSREIRSVDPQAMIFVTPLPDTMTNQQGSYAPDHIEKIVHAPHWYDGVTLSLQRYLTWLGVDTSGERLKLSIGYKRKRMNFAQQIRKLVNISEEDFGGVPTLIGETGIAFNLNNKKAYDSGDFTAQIMAMDDTIQALEANLVSYTLWNYTADNDNQNGDQWNDEDLSIFSRDQMGGDGSIHDGGRALRAVLRPYPLATPGEPLELTFDIAFKTFSFRFRNNPEIDVPLVLYVPDYNYPDGFKLEAPHCTQLETDDPQIVLLRPDKEAVDIDIRILPLEKIF